MAQAISFQQLTSLASAVGFTSPPGNAAMALIQAEGQPVRWRDDGTNPTASVGMVIGVGDVLVYNGSIGAIKFIETAASAKLNVTFY